MKKQIFILALALVGMTSCETCDCDYVTIESNPTNNYQWTETYRSDWTATCQDEIISSSVYTSSSGQKWYSQTEIQCR